MSNRVVDGMLVSVKMLLALLALPPLVLFASESTHVLTAQQWAVPRSGATVMRMDAVRAAMRDFELSGDARLLIRYPGGDEGTLWASELKAWLIALGVASDRIEMQPGSRHADSIEIDVIVAPAATNSSSSGNNSET